LRKTIFTLIIMLIIPLIVNISYSYNDQILSQQYSGTYSYICDVDDDGITKITIIYESSRSSGESWLLVPRNFTKYTIREISGRIKSSELKRAYTATGEEFTFYDNYTFTYIGSPVFKLEINYTMNNGALIVEPNCFFYSPQIYFSQRDAGIVYIYLPGNSRVSRSGVQPSPTDIGLEGGKWKITIRLQSNSARIAIEYTTMQTGNMRVYSDGIFQVVTPERYREVAENLIKTYKTFYNNLTKIFGVNLTIVKVMFFAPRIADLGTGGYIPFNGTHLGNIYLNLLYIRTAQGFWEQIALHELIHHFAWKAGISPNLLWVHEGLAEYLSIKLTMNMGWEGALSRMKTLEEISLQLKENYGFIQWWNPVETPSNILNYYAASYAIIKTILEGYGGLNLLQKLFNEIKGLTISDTETFINYLNIASKKDLTIKFIEWGFKISGGLWIYKEIIEAKYILMRKNFAQPFAWIANILLNLSQRLLTSEYDWLAIIIGEIGIFISYLAISLTVILWGGIIVIIISKVIKIE